MSGFFDSANPEEFVEKFSTSKIIGNRYLALRDIPNLIREHVSGVQVLDYGCGPGISTTTLKKLGLSVDGVDISAAMIEKAKEKDPAGRYQVIQSGEVPVPDHYYDLVLSSFVLMYVSTKEEIVKIFREMARILKPTGCFIAIINHEDIFNEDWTSVYTQFEENKNLRVGAPVKMLLKDINLLMHQYYWRESDFQEACDLSGLTIVQTHCPLGRDDDGFEWVREKQLPAAKILVIKRNNLQC